MKIAVIAIGKARGVEAELGAEYLKRMGGAVTVTELAAAKSLQGAEAQKAEAALLLKAIPAGGFVVALDERGKDLSSRDFAAKLEDWQQRGPLSFVIGGADGLTDDIKERADFIWGFGRLTWPHRLVRVMLLEQIYRARQIAAGHPYHRD